MLPNVMHALADQLGICSEPAADQPRMKVLPFDLNEPISHEETNDIPPEGKTLLPQGEDGSSASQRQLNHYISGQAVQRFAHPFQGLAGASNISTRPPIFQQTTLHNSQTPNPSQNPVNSPIPAPKTQVKKRDGFQQPSWPTQTTNPSQNPVNSPIPSPKTQVQQTNGFQQPLWPTQITIHLKTRSTYPSLPKNPGSTKRWFSTAIVADSNTKSISKPGQELALTLRNDLQISLGLMKDATEVLAYGKAVFEEYDPTFVEAFVCRI